MSSLFTCAYYNWKPNKREVLHFLSEVVTTSAVFAFCWVCNPKMSTLAYLVLSGAFSMGFLAHPYLGFWILQHLCDAEEGSPTNSQPTVSYYGSNLWNLANYNILLHVEHHDFSRIPWHKVGSLRDIAPEYYTNLVHCDSITKLVTFWVTARGKKMDFCCCHLFGQDFV